MTASMLLISAQSIAAGAGESRGIAIAVVGLVIVFTALLLISVFIASLPRILALVAQVWPELDEVHPRQSRPESQVPEEGPVLAAIGFVLHTEMHRQIAVERSKLAARPTLETAQQKK